MIKRTLMFGLPFELADEVVKDALMICYVLFGGMIATTWVPIIEELVCSWAVRRS